MFNPSKMYSFLLQLILSYWLLCKFYRVCKLDGSHRYFYTKFKWQSIFMCIERFSVMQYSALAVLSNVSKMSSLFHSCYYQHTSCLESYSGMSLYDCHRPSRPTIVYYFRVDQEFADSSPKVYIDCLKRSRYDWIRLCD